MRYAYNRYFMKIFLLNILLVSKIQVIFASIKRTFKKHLLSFTYFSEIQIIANNYTYFPLFNSIQYLPTFP